MSKPRAHCRYLWKRGSCSTSLLNQALEFTRHHPFPAAALSPHFAPQHPELGYLLTQRADQILLPLLSKWSCAGVFTAASPVPKLAPKGGQMQPPLPLQSGAAASPSPRVDRTQDSHLLCSTATPDPAKVLRAPGGPRASKQPPATPSPESRALPPHGNSPS